MRLLPAILFAGGMLFAAPLAMAQGGSPVGTWATEGEKSQVRIAPCGSALCGEIVSLKEPLDEAGQPRTDRNNPDPSLRGRPIVGLPLLRDFVPAAAPSVWENGTIYNPEDGKTYSCTLTLNGDGTLRVRGYVGIPLFGKTQIWTRVAG